MHVKLVKRNLLLKELETIGVSTHGSQLHTQDTCKLYSCIITYRGWDILRVIVWFSVTVLLVVGLYSMLVWTYGTALEVEEEELPNIFEGVSEIGTGLMGWIFHHTIRTTKRK